MNTTIANPTTAAPNTSSTVSPEIPATVKEIQPPVKPNALLFDEIPSVDEDIGYVVPVNFEPKNSNPQTTDESIEPSEIL